MDKSAHNEIRDFYAHMALTYERRFERCFCRYSGNIAIRYFLYNKKARKLKSEIPACAFYSCHIATRVIIRGLHLLHVAPVSVMRM